MLLLQLSPDAPRAGDRLFFAFRMEDGTTALTPAKANHGDGEHKCRMTHLREAGLVQLRARLLAAMMLGDGRLPFAKHSG